MPWFLTSIIGKRVAKGLSEPPSSCGYKWHDKRTFGFYECRDSAEIAVLKNKCNMHEGLYEFLVIEHIEEGVHPLTLSEKWYRWDYEKHHWKECRRPKQFLGTINWALG